ncbi:helix-turn-helix domain-containing protein [Tetragenococcus muriaticus]|uniref:helix-turn-helix domain-containing protein n=1 Tax=Tetragenococcus muriaticus TaxID=64642 RepID=UPI002F3509CD
MVQKDETAKLKQALTVAQLYYEDGLSQAAIAKKLQMSRPTISRFLQLAKEEGLVKIQVENPFVDYQDLSEILSEKYQLKIQVVPEQYQEKKTNVRSFRSLYSCLLNKNCPTYRYYRDWMGKNDSCCDFSS